MRRGFLSQYFVGVAIKRLRAVEVDPCRSNQHEFNGVRPLRNLFGAERRNCLVRFVWLGGENEGFSEDVWVTWYDARENQPHRSSEYRLYFRKNQVMDKAQEGDLLIVAKRPNEEFYMIVVPAGSTMENQLLWLFGVSEQISFEKFNFQSIEEGHNPEVDFAVRFILDELEIEIEEPDTDYLDALLRPYLESGFPSTKEFSAFARNTVKDVSVLEEPDKTLILWMEQEEKLFKRLERHIVAKKLEQGFQKDGTTDVDGFIDFSLRVHNRRKSRVGHALENHLEEIFNSFNVSYSRNKVTENNSKPDFIFPSIEFYHDPNFPESRLTMLGVKSTCKDRWRQVLSEAARIKHKHLFTLEPGISENQTAEMQANNLQLVVPKPIHITYTIQQQAWLLDLESFIRIVKERQTN